MYLQRQFITMTPRALFNTIRSSIAMSATSPSPAEARSFSAKSLHSTSGEAVCPSDESLPLTTAADEAFCLPEEALPLTTDEAVGIPDQLLRLTMANNNTTSESTISNVQ